MKQPGPTLDDEVSDSQGEYPFGSHNELKKFIDDAVQSRVEEINEENIRRAERFKLDAEKLRQAFHLHDEDKPDPKNFGKTDELALWNQKLLDLERKAQTAERQYRLHVRSLENPNVDVLKRTAKRHVAEQHPTEYRAYQDSVKLQRMQKQIADLGIAEIRLDELMQSNAPTRHITTAARKVSSLVQRLEKSDLFDERSSSDEKQQLAAAKTKVGQVLTNTRDERGHEL